eukprot:GFKZ01015168.1.p1 GENE.GFKZ01015168.1~~GFKZ01015168.1.p1  ORF type:complete len:489 (-),score=57.77 GFKZ01015168.1:864-2330(-)
MVFPAARDTGKILAILKTKGSRGVSSSTLRDFTALCDALGGFQKTTSSVTNFVPSYSDALSLADRSRYVRKQVAPVVCSNAYNSRRLAVKRSIYPDGTVHPLKVDVSQQQPIPKRNHPTDREGRVILKNMTLLELEDWVMSLGHKRFRARQLWKWMYKWDKLASSFEEMTDLSKDFRDMLRNKARLDTLGIDSIHESDDGTKKLIYRLEGGGVIESVLIPTEGRTTVCISSQSGCGLNCQFCLTGRTGFKRSLTSGEIVEQVIVAKRFFEKVDKISNVVFMGEGEPANNLDNVIRAVDVLLDKDGLDFSHNKVTVSTSGLIPEIRRFAQSSKANLAVSLHATNDELRSWLMPINRKYPLRELMKTLRDVFPRAEAKQKKVFFQYLMLKGVNDSLMDAKELLRLTAGVPCKINLIHFNTHEGSEFEASDEETMLAFQDYLVRKGMTVTIRKSRGDEKMMACGQLGKLGPVQAPRMAVPQRYMHLFTGAT